MLTTFNKHTRVLTFLLAGGILVILSFNSCYNNKAEILFPQTVCDTAAVTYRLTIVPILSSNCTPSCHSGIVPTGGIYLDNYGGVKQQVDNGKLWGAVTHSSGYSPMPKNGNKLSDCNLSKIRTWILAGAPNN